LAGSFDFGFWLDGAAFGVNAAEMFPERSANEDLNGLAKLARLAAPRLGNTLK